jgi:methylmalonyl-CoA mutase
VVDPAGGSWAVEWLTGQVSEKSWAFFQEIETKGGIVPAIKDGFIAEKLAKTAAGQEKQLNQRRVSLVGTNVYPNLEEEELEARLPDYTNLRESRAKEIARARVELDEDADAKVMAALGKVIEVDRAGLIPAVIDAIRAGATLGEVTKTVRASAKPSSLMQPLPVARLSAKYEALRAAAATYKANHGHGPKLFLCNLGALRRHKARADFTKGFFQSGGFEVISSAGFETPEAAVAALGESGAALTVVCGTDADYEENFASYASAIKQALPNTRVLLAGFPGAKEADYRAAGMDDFIFVKSDNYATNRQALELLGVL